MFFWNQKCTCSGGGGRQSRAAQRLSDQRNETGERDAKRGFGSKAAVSSQQRGNTSQHSTGMDERHNVYPNRKGHKGSERSIKPTRREVVPWRAGRQYGQAAFPHNNTSTAQDESKAVPWRRAGSAATGARPCAAAPRRRGSACERAIKRAKTK